MKEHILYFLEKMRLNLFSESRKQMAPNKTLMNAIGLLTILITTTAAEYKIGIGISDVTGPVAEIVFVSII